MIPFPDTQCSLNPATGDRLNGNELTLKLFWGCEGSTNTDIEGNFKKKIKPPSLGSVCFSLQINYYSSFEPSS